MKENKIRHLSQEAHMLSRIETITMQCGKHCDKELCKFCGNTGDMYSDQDGVGRWQKQEEIPEQMT